MMKKIISIGEKEVSIGIDREIVCDVVDKFSKVFADYFDLAADASKEKQAEAEADGSETSDLIRKVADNIRDKKLSKILMLTEHKRNVMLYAFPKLIKKANREMPVEECITKANEIENYCAENDADEVLADVIFDFINEGFTAAEEKTPKIQITIQ